LVEKVS